MNHVKERQEWVAKPPEKQVLFVLYDLRHTFATRLAEAGVDLATIAAILGHSGLRIVTRYIHITEKHQQEAMLRYDAALAEAQKAQQQHVVRRKDDQNPAEAQKGRASFGPVVM